MASPPFEVEDQLDEEFFDKLVNDDDDFDFTGSSGKLLVEATDSEELKAFSNLTISETIPPVVDSDGKDLDFGLEAEKGREDGGNSALLDGNEDAVVANESSSVVPINVKDCSEIGTGEGGVLDSETNNSGAASGTGVKEVQWSSFNSDANAQSSGVFRTYSEIFNDLGDNSEDPFAEVGIKDDLTTEFNVTTRVLGDSVSDLASSSYIQNNDVQHNGVRSEQNVDGQDLSNSQYWENLYPGWRYDPNTGQWYQVEGYDMNTTMNSQESLGVSHSASDGLMSNQNLDTHSSQQTAQSVMGTVAEDFGNSSHWNQIPQGNAEYPAHMVFDLQYPGWYYDTIAQEWKMLESYTPAVDQSATMDHNQQYQNKNIESYESQALGSQDQVMNQGEFASNYHQQNMSSFQAYSVSKRGTEVFSETKQLENLYSPVGLLDNHAEQQNGFQPSKAVAPYEQLSHTVSHSAEFSRFQSFIPAQSYNQFDNQTAFQPDQQMQFRPAFIDAQKSGNHPQQPLQIGTSFSSSPNEGRSSAGRPPHALVSFGFGGKLVVVKNNSFSHTTSLYENQGSVAGVINVLNLMEVVKDNSGTSNFGCGANDYLQTLCQQSFPGPLVGGNIGNKELYKWIDERIANFESSSLGYRGEVLRLLFSLLKISCQYYGKLRSHFGTDQTLKESDIPELAVAKLLGSVKGKGMQSSAYGALMPCLQNLPSEAQMQATALEVQKLLVSGRKKEALEFAQEGQLWGPALVIATQLGDQFYGDTVKLMALKQLAAGSPLRTLCLLIAGQPAEVFSPVFPSSNLPGYVNTADQPGQIGANMLNGWEENLAIITANRTKDDELVIIHLGDCLWKEGVEVAAAHICYLVAEANFEPYSDGARLCLIGADHWNCPRTYASPEAIQRTELYEYSKVLGNSQYLILPFQPYKLIYSYMLAEVGKVAESLKYCQAILKSSKTGRAPEVETWKQLVSSLEERLRIHQQGGYHTNLTPNKLVGKLLTFFDNTAQRVVGGQPPPPPSTMQSSVHGNELLQHPGGSKASNSQPTMPVQSLMSSAPMASTMAMPSLMPSASVESTMAMPSLMPSASVESTMAMSLMPSASMEPISEWAGQSDLSTMPGRSISEPDFGHSNRKVNSSNEANSSGTKEKAAVSSGSSRFGRFGSQLFQKTVGLVIRSRPHRQAKLGDANKFYYDEKLKRWVEEGAEPPAEEAALPPPPTSAAFQNGMNDLSMKDSPKIESLQTSSDNRSPISSDKSSGIPPIPPSSNQYSARARMGVRSRYVDTFNKSGGSPVHLFQSPSVPSAKPVAGSSPKFFIPSVSPTEEMVQNTGERMQEAVLASESPTSFKQDSSPVSSFSLPASTSASLSSSSLSSLSSLSVTMQRFPSMDNIVHKRVAAVEDSNSRRTASWSGSLNNASRISATREIKPLGMPSSLYADSNSGEDLHEIKL